MIEKIGNDYDRNLSPGCAGVIRRERKKQLSCFVGRFVLGFKVPGKHGKRHHNFRQLATGLLVSGVSS